MELELSGSTQMGTGEMLLPHWSLLHSLSKQRPCGLTQRFCPAYRKLLAPAMLQHAVGLEGSVVHPSPA